jgi:DNA polymerase
MTDIVIVGEAWGKDEEAAGGTPFVGWAGRLLNAFLSQVGINRKDCYVTNVFNFKPDRNDIKTLCGSKAEAIPGYPALTKGKFLRNEYAPELERLYREIRSVNPNLVIALGGTAAWALLRTSGISKVRGTPLQSSIVGCKVLPTYHPAALARDWSLRPVLLADLEKAARESQYPDIRRPNRTIWIEPTIPDLYEFERRHIGPSSVLSIDIETWGRQITCIGFAPSPYYALVVPFFDRSQADGNYWRSKEEEVKVWAWVKKICNLPKHIVGQNFLYDMNHLWSNYGISVPHVEDDTMLLHHALYPELPKGLGFMGSVYTDEVNWKINRDLETLKKED